MIKELTVSGMELWENIYDSVAVQLTWWDVRVVGFVHTVLMNCGYVFLFYYCFSFLFLIEKKGIHRLI